MKECQLRDTTLWNIHPFLNKCLSAHIKFIEMCLMEVVDGQVVPQGWKEISSVCGNFVFSPDASFIEMFHLGLEFIHNEIEVILRFVLKGEDSAEKLV